MSEPVAIDVVESALHEARVNAEKRNEYWVAQFQSEDGRPPVSVMVLPDKSKEYVNIASPIRLTITPAEMSQPVLLDLLRISTFISLAKMEMAEINGKLWFAATSECAYEGLNGRKLRRRMEACAELVRQLRTALAAKGLLRASS